MADSSDSDDWLLTASEKAAKRAGTLPERKTPTFTLDRKTQRMVVVAVQQNAPAVVPQLQESLQYRLILVYINPFVSGHLGICYERESESLFSLQHHVIVHEDCVPPSLDHLFLPAQKNGMRNSVELSSSAFLCAHPQRLALITSQSQTIINSVTRVTKIVQDPVFGMTLGFAAQESVHLIDLRVGETLLEFVQQYRGSLFHGCILKLDFALSTLRSAIILLGCTGGVIVFDQQRRHRRLRVGSDVLLCARITTTSAVVACRDGRLLEIDTESSQLGLRLRVLRTIATFKSAPCWLGVCAGTAFICTVDGGVYFVSLEHSRICGHLVPSSTCASVIEHVCGVSQEAQLVVSLLGSLMRVWHAESRQLIAQLTFSTGFDARSIELDSSGSQIFVGCKRQMLTLQLC